VQVECARLVLTSSSFTNLPRQAMHLMTPRMHQH